ncbi:MAG: hypothetical protein A3I13_05885 [Gammaproteobacteria bacterium RIFCSPLOWO2_02_FULL_47_50]|nr:MAG: hypothetical protein A2W69_00030 [Gammaproteobacteria bacterium RIFCSPLOWO2_02_47_7]OGT65737.1 MAG: hypothetical protein A2993_01590 [Gammaproteobacteria bacterium RIFCSPLOWO2_01_FULL_47_190]OGT73175.1 MAG: hypothetical protein A2W76_10885 [Gammaproteobacteria bacterium RIFCSPLOWO2_12_47_11]OGT78886.1 MAG: hypothetical protein A3I13_05885 [Gammaproteobacteria bacterium RIFCSPLOWO2_02_FULL_47_50]OGT86834.1 MAG: hypothetical protein A3G42_03940 [Gammaproteobacteria bacterium RIFCSPLOWO2_1
MNHSGSRYFDLSHFSMLQISGNDAFEFLHGQVTGDLNQLKLHGWLFSAWCLPNGRVICTFIIFTRDDSLFLILPSMLKDKIIGRLSMFIMRSHVTLKDVSDDYTLMGLEGNDIEKILMQTTTHEPFVTGSMIQSEYFSCLKLWDKTPRYILAIKMENVAELPGGITATSTAGERAGWSLLDIEAGMPWIINSTSETFLPQMLNIDQMHGLSYQKGCYPGQEVIARLHYRGQLKKKMYLGSGNAGIIPGAGDRLVHKDSGAVAGDVIDAERYPAGGFRLLAVVEIQSADSEDLCLEGATDISARLQPITYPA